MCYFNIVIFITKGILLQICINEKPLSVDGGFSIGRMEGYNGAGMGEALL